MFGRQIALACSLIGFLAYGETTPLSILHENCSRCHSPAKRKGGLLIDSKESLLRGGDSGPAVEPGKAGESYLIETLFPDADSHMPPKGQLSPQEISTLEAWVNAGLAWDGDEWTRLTRPKKIEVELSLLPSSFSPVLAMALSPDGKTLAAGRGGTIDLFRVVPSEDARKPPQLQPAGSLAGHSDVVQSLAFSPDGKFLVSGGFRRLLWHPMDDSSPPPAAMTEPFLGRLTALAFSPDGKTLIAADSMPSQASALRVIDAANRKVLRSVESAHDDAIYDLAFSRDGKWIASASADKLALVRDTKDFAITTSLEGHTSYVLGVAFSPDGTRIATAGDDEVVKVWNTRTADQVLSFATKKSGPVGGVAWTTDPDNLKKKEEEKDEKKKAEINTDRIVAINDLGQPGTFTQLNEHEGAQRSTGARELRHTGVSAALTSMAYDEENLILFAGSEDGRLFAWDKAGKKIQEIGREVTPGIDE